MTAKRTLRVAERRGLLRRSLAVLVLGSMLGLAACSGDTDPATDVTNVSARLNAHGHTTGEPATWWWEYDTVQSDLGTENDTEVCGAGTGPKEADNRCGPASWENRGDINLNVVVSGLAPNTTYYYRACGQDQSWSSGACGKTLSFKTLAGTAYAFDRKWGSLGSGNGQFNRPMGIAVDSSNNVYVADSNNHRIQKFGPSGNFITKWGRNMGDGSSGSGDGEFDSPLGVGVGILGNVYVADTNNNRIQWFSSTGGFLGKWGTSGTGDGQFNGPTDVAVSRQSRLGVITYPVYVADTVNNRIQRFDSDGSFFSKWGTGGTGDGQFNYPYGIAAYRGGGGNVYVADTYKNRVQRFKPIQ